MSYYGQPYKFNTFWGRASKDYIGLQGGGLGGPERPNDITVGIIWVLAFFVSISCHVSVLMAPDINISCKPNVKWMPQDG